MIWRWISTHSSNPAFFHFTQGTFLVGQPAQGSGKQGGSSSAGHAASSPATVTQQAIRVTAGQKAAILAQVSIGYTTQGRTLLLPPHCLILMEVFCSNFCYVCVSQLFHKHSQPCFDIVTSTVCDLYPKDKSVNIRGSPRTMPSTLLRSSWRASLGFASAFVLPEHLWQSCLLCTLKYWFFFFFNLILSHSFTPLLLWTVLAGLFNTDSLSPHFVSSLTTQFYQISGFTG